MSGEATAVALDVIEGELQHVPEGAARSALAERLLGALEGRFLLIPRPTEAEERATRADLDFVLPGLFRRGARS